ncbi:MAG: NfeD family protein [Odoribacter sp.]|nr:NfeD family protein [Odoribacter sp.]
MKEFWIALTPFMKTVWCITVFSSLVFIIQSIMTFAGMDSDGGMDVDTDGMSDGGGPFQLFTFRNFINFFLGFGWSLITFEKMINNEIVWILVSALIGVLLVVAVMFIFRFLSRMEQSGTIEVSRAINSKGSVYLKIPAAKKGEGKVQISIQGAVREYNALTEGEELETGAPIRVVEVVGGNTLIVERF